MRRLKQITHDTASTLVGLLLAGGMTAADAYLKGGAPSKETLVASAVIGAAGWWFKRGNQTPVVRD